jgi:hypothetical protein
VQVSAGSTKNSFKVGEFSNDGIQAPNNLAFCVFTFRNLKFK